MRPRRIPSRKPTAQSGRVLHRLTQDKVAQLLRDHTQGRHADGGNLYLRIRPNAAPTWVFLYQPPGAASPREMRLGDARGMTLARARDLARAARDERAIGADPLAAREQARESERAERHAAEQEAERESATLAREARRHHELVSSTFHNPKHAAQWINSLEQHVPARLWHMPIADAAQKHGEFLEFLQPLYITKRETASRVRLRLDAVFDDAMLRGLCTANPAAAIKKSLAKFAGKRRKGSFAAYAWAKMPGFMKRLRALDGITPRALEFTILTVARSGETRGMEWSETDLRAATWTVSAERMKAGEPHLVYLSDPALAIVKDMRGLDPRLVFPSLARPGKPLSNMAMLELLKQMGVNGEATVHGFRASFSTWANESGRYRSDVIEACLAHQEEDRVRAAYNRAHFAAERKQLLTDWAAFVGGEKQARVANLSEARSARAPR